MSAWTLIFSNGRDHRLFKNEAGQISIADSSGGDPDQTDDGPLIVTPGVECPVGQLLNASKSIHVGVPVIVKRTQIEGACFVSLDVALALKKHCGIKVFADTNFASVVKQLAALEVIPQATSSAVAVRPIIKQLRHYRARRAFRPQARKRS